MIKKIIYYYKCFISSLTHPSSTRNVLSPVFLSRYFFRKRIEEARGYFKGIVTDIGCGKKPYASIISKSARYIGFDYPDLVFNFRGVERSLLPDVYGDGFNLPFRNDSIDCAVNTNVLEYISEPGCFIKEIARILKPGGTIIMSVPFTYPIHHETHDFFRYSRAGIIYLLEKNNVQIIWIKTNGGFWITMGQLFLYFLNFKFLFRSKHDILWLLFGGIRLLLTPVILIGNCIFNVFAVLLDRIYPGPYLTLNYSLVAQKRER